jgi:hypothetical protein
MTKRIEAEGTYTIAHTNVILAVVKDGQTPNALAVALDFVESDPAYDEIDESDIEIEEGLTLTDEPEDGDEIFWRGDSMGYMSDSEGNSYEYAVHRD